ncbi:MAG TPA: LamG-like jellyroll fold domain-containing protein [Streptosporangiaceae bacterium]|nr:LamG-like jellyroll fold domain-containing protein [Streptosporangiaceae bacterium]
MGTGIGSDGGPADWSGTEVLHGDLTGNRVQDVLAYYPAHNVGQLIGGSNAFPLAPFTENLWSMLPSGNPPLQLVAAGNASQQNTGISDLIGVVANTTGYELDLYTSFVPAGYSQASTLSAASPDGSPTDWNDYTLATAQPGNDASSTVLFALDKSTGALYESTNPTHSTTALIGTPGTWTGLTVPWGPTPPQLVSADINAAGQTELWTVSGQSATAYTLSGATLTQEAKPSSVARPADEWPLTGSGLDTTGGNSLGFSASGVGWTGDSFFLTAADLDGRTGYLAPPASTISATVRTPRLSVWFRTAAPGGVIASVQSHAISSGASTTASYNPLMYVGTDGKFYAQWPNGGITPVVSTNPVDNGNWHHAVLTATTADSGSQSLYLDGRRVGTLKGAVSLSQTNPTHLTFGTGYIGGDWPSEPHNQPGSTTGYLDYFQGQLAEITYSH